MPVRVRAVFPLLGRTGFSPLLLKHPSHSFSALAVCQNDGHRDTLARALAGLWRTVIARETDQGLAHARTLAPSLVVACDDLALVRAIRADVRIAHVPILLLLAAGANADSEIRALETGADAVLVWPVAPEKIRAWARRLVETRHALRERWSQRAALTRDAGDSPEIAFLDHVREAVEAGMSTPGFSTADLAYALHIGPRQLTRRLKALTGETPSALVRRLRMSRAADLLASGEAVKRAARAAGYTSRSQFRTAFEAAYGVLPSAYAVRGAPASPLPAGSAQRKR